MTNEYSTRVYYALGAFLTLLLIYIILVPLEMWLFASVFRLTVVVVVFSVLVTFALPLIYIKKIKERYTKDAFLKFGKFGFTIVTGKTNGKERTEKYEWKDIRAYKIRFTQSNLTYVDIYFNNGNHEKYGFLDNKSRDEAFNGDSIFGMFFSYIKAYNSDKTYDERITLKPGFLTTNTGTTILYFCGVLFLTCIVVALFVNPKGFPFLLMGGMSFLVILLQRKKDKELYDILNSKELD